MGRDARRGSEVCAVAPPVNSAMPEAERKKFLGQGEHSLVSRDIRDVNKSMDCPFPLTTTCRKRPRH